MPEGEGVTVARVLDQLATGEYVDPDAVLAITISDSAPGVYLRGGQIMWVGLLPGETVQQGADRIAAQFDTTRRVP